MKKIFMLIIAICMILVLMTGFTKDKSNPVKKNINNIESMNLTGGTPGFNSKALFPQSDKIKIEKILKLLENCSNWRELKDNEYPAGRGYFISIAVKIKDGSHIYISPAVKYTVTKYAKSGVPFKDRVIITIEKNKISTRYIMFSKNMAMYFDKKISADFPHEKFATIYPEEFNVGNSVVISGGGSIEKEVKIYLDNSSLGGNEEYLIGVVKPILGEWKWKCVLSKDIKAFDAKTIHFKGDKYYITVRMGDKSISFGQILNFRDSK